MGIPELTRRLTDAVWSELQAGSNVTTTRRDLQRVWTEKMTTLVVDLPERTPSDARSVARIRLREVREQIEKHLASDTKMAAYTQAHLEESVARIEEILEASTEIQH